MRTQEVGSREDTSLRFFFLVGPGEGGVEWGLLLHTPASVGASGSGGQIAASACWYNSHPKRQQQSIADIVSGVNTSSYVRAFGLFSIVLSWETRYIFGPDCMSECPSCDGSECAGDCDIANMKDVHAITDISEDDRVSFEL